MRRSRRRSAAIPSLRSRAGLAAPVTSPPVDTQPGDENRGPACPERGGPGEDLAMLAGQRPVPLPVDVGVGVSVPVPGDAAGVVTTPPPAAPVTAAWVA